MALHLLLRKIENALDHTQIALTAFLNIKSAFDHTGHTSIRQATVDKAIEPDTIKWIMNMLEYRIVSTQLDSVNFTMKTVRSFPQRGVLSPLL